MHKTNKHKSSVLASLDRLDKVGFLMLALMIVAAGLIGLGLVSHQDKKEVAYAPSSVVGQTDFAAGFVNGVIPDGSSLNGPQGTSIDETNHRLFVTDASNQRVLVYNLSAGNVLTDKTADYVLGQPTLNDNRTQANSAVRLNSPSEVAYAADKQWLFVTSGSNVAIFDLSGGITNGMQQTYTIGATTLGGYGGTTTQNTFFNITGMTYDSLRHRLFVSDYYRVLVFDLSGSVSTGMNASYILGQSTYTDENYVCSPPNDHDTCSVNSIAMDEGHNRLYVSQNSRITVYDFSSGISNNMSASYVLGQPNFTSLGGSGIGAGEFYSVKSMVYQTSADRLFAFDEYNTRVLVFDMAGGITNGMNASYVLGQPNFNSQSYGTTQSMLSRFSEGLGVSSNGKVYVGDTYNNRIMIFDVSGGITNGMNASDVLGQTLYTTSYINGVNQPGPSGFRAPQDLALDTSDHRMFIADYGNSRVVEYDLDSQNHVQSNNATHIITHADFYSTDCKPGSCYPTAVAYDTVHDRLFVASSQNYGAKYISVYDLSGGVSDNMTPTVIFGDQDCTIPATGPTSMCQVTKMAYDSNHDRLFVADSTLNRILSFDLSGGITSNIGPAQILSSSNCNFFGTTDASSFCSPQSIAYDASHDRLYISDFGGNRVLQYELSSGISNGMAASRVIGADNLTTIETCSKAANRFCRPGDIAYDSSKQLLFVSGGDSSSLRVFDMSNGPTNGMNALDLIGQDSFSSTQEHCFSAGDNISNGLCDYGPSGMAITADGTFYVNDTPNNRLMTYSLPFDIFNTTLPNGSINASYSHTLSAMYGIGSNAWDITVGALPAGLSLNPTTGVISGTPTVSGDFTFTVRATDSMSTVATKQINLHINPEAGITTTTLPNGTVNSAYSQTIQAVGTPALSFSVATGSLPNGLTLNGSTGQITGTPTLAGDFNFTIQLNDGNNTSDTQALSIHINNIAVTINTTTLPDASRGLPYSTTLVTVGGTAPYTFAVISGSLPAGLTLNSSTGKISGAATTVGNNMFTIRATDSTSATTTRALSINVNASQPGYGASDLLGQIDSEGNPVWTSVNNYNGGSIDGRGFSYPQGTVVDEVHHRLFVSTCGSRVLVYNLDANNDLLDRVADYALGQPNLTSDNYSTPVNASTLSCPVGSSYDPVHDRLFVPDDGRNRVLVYDTSNLQTGMSASYVLGQPNFNSSSSVLSQNGMGYPYGGSAYDTDTQYLYVSDSENMRVLVFDLSSGISSGMNAAYVIGQPDFTTANCVQGQSGIGFPYSLAIDIPHNRLFVGDDETCGGHHRGRVLVFDTSNLQNGMSASYVLGKPDFTAYDTNSDTPVRNNVINPDNLAYDSGRQRLFVQDDNFNRILVFDLSGGITNGMDASAVLGQPDFFTDDYSCNPNQQNQCDAEGQSDYFDVTNNRLYVSDSSHNRVLLFSFITLGSGGLAASNAGTAYTQQLSITNSQGNVTYNVVSGALPTGLTLNATTGVISGTATTAGSFVFTIKANDDLGDIGNFYDTKQYTITVAGPAPTPAPTPTSSSVVSKPIQAVNTFLEKQTPVTDVSEIILNTIEMFLVSDDVSNAFQTNVSDNNILRFALPFTPKPGQATTPHSVTINSVKKNSVAITIASDPIYLTLSLGERRLVDVDGDGVNDLGVALNDIVNNQAVLAFWRPVIEAAKPTANVPDKTDTELKSDTKSNNELLYYGVGAVVGLIIISNTVILIKRHHN